MFQMLFPLKQAGDWKNFPKINSQFVQHTVICTSKTYITDIASSSSVILDF